MNIYLKDKDYHTVLEVLKDELSSRHNYIWTTKDGSNINVKDMTDFHLKNTIALIEEKIELKQIINGGCDNDW